jgi:hypothetical protein
MPDRLALPIVGIERYNNNNKRGSHRRKKTTYKYPYSLMICQRLSRHREIVSMGRRRAWMFSEGVQAGVDSIGVNNKPEQLH